MSRFLQLSPEIMVFFGLRKQPFAPPEKLADIYLSQCLLSLRDKLEDFLLTQNKLAFITGETGIGTSTMAQFLVANSSPRLVPFLIKGNPSLNSTEVLLSICHDYEDQERLIEATRQGKSVSKFASSHLFDLMKRELQPAIIIDQAHTASARLVNDIIRFCDAVNSRGRGLLKLVLVYSGTLEKWLPGIRGEWVKAQQFQEFQMSNLKKGEARKYLLHRLKNAGLSVKLPFTEQTIMVMSDRSRGVPAALDKLVIQSLNGRARALAQAADETELSLSEQERLEELAFERRERLNKILPPLIILALLACAALGVYLSL